MSTATHTRSTRQDFAQSGWGAGFSVFAGSMMAVTGVFQFFEGLVAVVNGNDFLVQRGSYVFKFDATAWGWVHIVIGLVLLAAGVGIFTGNLVARGVGILLACLSMIANFLWMPYYPLWSVVLIAINVFVVFALCSVDLGDSRR